AARTHYLPNFVDARPAAPLARQALGCPETAPLLLALGRLHANKAFDVLLRALVALPGAHLCIAGEGPERTTLTALARTLGVADRTGFLGWRDDAPALLATADVLVCPSRREPLGNVVIEAWAHGCPVVAAAAAGPAGLIRDDASGLLVPVEDVAALAAAITRALADAGLRRRLIAGGRAAHAADFTEEAVVRRYLEFFGRIAA
ncbi:MAG: glycosyltransferase, partial [Alphaproteobacteria bacterium]|nr:glycosyltransferase [Alphaproteobacteria bacterium]